MPNDGSVNGDGGERERDDTKRSGSSKKDNGSTGNDICRDYLNNICNRGNRCKFYHPEEHDGKALNAAEEPYQFCIDFQNQGCHRDNCRYVHAFREDVDRYKRSGDVTLGLARALAALMRGDNINGIPICKEFQNGHCARGSQCRYWHINKDEERRKRFAGRGSGGSGAPTSPGLRPFGAYSGPSAAGGGLRRRGDDYGGYDDYGPPSSKRGSSYAMGMGMTPGIPPGPPARAFVDLERRNAELNAEVDSLKRELQREKERYDDLMALFRATQTNQTMQQQRPMQMGAQGTAAAAQQPIQQQSIPSLSMQQQPALQQQWGSAAGTTSANYLAGKYDWAAN